MPVAESKVCVQYTDLLFSVWCWGLAVFTTFLLSVITEQHVSRDLRKPVIGVLTRSDTNWLVQSQKEVRILKFLV